MCRNNACKSCATSLYKRKTVPTCYSSTCAHLYKAPPCFLPLFLGSHWRRHSFSSGHTQTDSWNDVSKRTHTSHTFKHNLYCLAPIRKCGFVYLWKLAQLRNSTPLTERSRNLLTTSATAGFVPGNHGLDVRVYIVCAHLKYNSAHNQA